MKTLTKRLNKPDFKHAYSSINQAGLIV